MSVLSSLLVLVVIVGNVLADDFKESICLDGEQGNLTISCPEDQVIRVDDAVFGYNRWGSCIITTDDCVEKTRAFQICDGQTSCTHTFKTFTKTCGYSTMLLLGYTCIRVYKEVATPIPVESRDITFETGAQEPGLMQEPEQTTRSVRKTPRSSDSSSQSGGAAKETGLIVGCAIASLATVTVLVIAIVMVVRRLMQPNGKDEKSSESSSDSCCDTFCIKIDCLPCCGRSETPPEKSHDIRMRKASTTEIAQNQDKSKLRVAPIGQESSSDISSAPSDSPEFTAVYADITDAVSDIASTSGCKKSNPQKPQRQKHSSLLGDPQTKNSQFQNAKDKNPELEKETSPRSLYANDNTLPSSANKNLKPTRGERDDFITSEKIPPPCNKAAGTHERAPMFDAVALPNTYGGTAC